MGFLLLVRLRVSFSFSCRIHLTCATMSNNVPKRWTEYSAVGKRIPGTRFIAFKVPLQKLFDNNLEPEQRFSPTNLISEIEKQNEELGLVVDLTFTSRYYNHQEFPTTVEYAKIFTAGHSVPSDDVIHEFKSIVTHFVSENAGNDKLIGVHCTHGLNRTGYLVCRYMIDVLGMVPSEAIERFNKSRGHCIERENYLDDLLQGKPRNHPCTNPSWGPRLSAPPFSQLPRQYIPGPQRSFHQRSQRQPGFPIVNPGIGHLPVFPYPFMPGPRYSNPHIEVNQQQHFRGGPQRYRHHPKRPFAQQQDDVSVNGAPRWDHAPHRPPNFVGHMRNSSDYQGSSPQVHGHNGPYSRWPGQGHKGTSGQQWQ